MNVRAAIVRAVWRHPRTVLVVALAIAVAAGVLASRLGLRSNLAELLESKDPVVREVHRIADRLPSTLVMIVVIEGPDRNANHAAADRVGAELAKLQPGLVASVISDIRSERAFFDERKWLYADLSTLEAIRDELRLTIARAKNPLLVEIDDDNSLASLKAKLQRQSTSVDRFPTGYFESADGTFVTVLVRPARGTTGEDVGGELRIATERAVAALALPPYVHVSLGGNLIVSLDERGALMHDLARASLVCLVLVAVVVLAYFGRFRVVAMFAVPALIGVTIGYGVAELAWGYVNIAAAFMGTIIVGNGINFAIVQQARYDEQRRAGMPALEAAIAAVEATSGATMVAALAAAVAYASMTVTEFRGFSQFGAIGALGMIAAWIATIVVLPAVWALVDAGAARRRFALTLGRAPEVLVGRPKMVLACGLGLAVVAAALLPGYLANPFEYDLTKLRNRATRSVEISSKVEELFGETVSPPVILAIRRDQVPEIAEHLRARALTPDGKLMISAIRTIDDLIPRDQPAKLAVLAQLRTQLDDPDLSDLEPKLRADLDALRPPATLHAITIDELPATVKNLFSEIDGTVGRLILIYDHPHITAYDGRAQQRLAGLVGEVQLSDGTVARCPILFAALIRGIVHDAPISTGLALLGVVLLVSFVERSRRGIGLVIGALVVGVLWFVGAAAVFGIKVNFLNFIALPITFGIGVDYTINMYRRCTREIGDIASAVRGIGGALILCSSTTVIGYGALLAADNQALRSFGQMAILGEVATLVAALTLIPAAITLLRSRA